MEIIVTPRLHGLWSVDLSCPGPGALYANVAVVIGAVPVGVALSSVMGVRIDCTPDAVTYDSHL